MFKVNNRDTKIRKVNDKVKNKDTVNVVVASLVSTLNTFHFLLQSFSVNCQLGLLFVVLTLCVCWNQFKQSLQGGLYIRRGDGLIFSILIGLHIWGAYNREGACRRGHINRILPDLDRKN